MLDKIHGIYLVQNWLIELRAQGFENRRVELFTGKKEGVKCRRWESGPRNDCHTDRSKPIIYKLIIKTFINSVF